MKCNLQRKKANGLGHIVYSPPLSPSLSLSEEDYFLTQRSLWVAGQTERRPTTVLLPTSQSEKLLRRKKVTRKTTAAVKSPLKE
jgi:hypothetical protein